MVSYDAFGLASFGGMGMTVSVEEIARLQTFLREKIGELVDVLEFEQKEYCVSVQTKHYIQNSDDWATIHDTIKGEPLKGMSQIGERGKWYWDIENSNIRSLEPTVEPIELQIANKQLQKERQISESKEYDLALSKQKLGALVPVLTDSKGNIIDGFHRKEVDPKWPTVSLPYIKDAVQLSMARLASNVCRREVSAEEKTKLLSNIAELTGWNPKEIADALGMSYQWVCRYLPEKFKDQEKIDAGHVGGQALKEKYNEVALQRRAESQDIRQEPFESKSLTPTIPTKEIDTGFVFECPTCERKFHLIHIDPSGRHKFEEDKGEP